MSPTPRARFKRNYMGFRPWSRHSLVLLVAGIVYVCVGGIYWFTPDGSPTWRALAMAREWFPLQAWAVLWAFVGGLAILSARWPPRVETWGYMALTALSAGWGVFYILGVIFGENSFGSLAVGMMWALVAFLWWAISGLLSPENKGVNDGRR